MSRKRSGFTLIELMIVIAIIAVIAAIAIPGLLAAQRSSNERNASASMKTIGTAQADFRASDRDGNRVPDYWTGDVAGLCLLVPQPPAGGVPAAVNMNLAIKLVDVSIAAADGQAGGAGTNYTAGMHVAYADAFSVFSAKSSYHFKCLRNDNTGGVVNAYRVDTDATAEFLTCHNLDRFGFLAFPTTLNGGRLAYILNQDNTIFRINLLGNYTATMTNVGTANNTTTTLANTGSASLDGADTQDYPDNPLGNGFAKMD